MERLFSGVDGPTVKIETVAAAVGLGRARGDAAKNDFDARNQFARGKRFNDIIICADFEADNAVGFFGFSGKQYHRGAIMRRDMSAKAKPVFVRHHDVEQHQINVIG